MNSNMVKLEKFNHLYLVYHFTIIPLKIVSRFESSCSQLCRGFTFEILTQCINKSFASGEFPDCLKQANVLPIFKKDDPLDKEHARPVSILPLLLKG